MWRLMSTVALPLPGCHAEELASSLCQEVTFFEMPSSESGPSDVLVNDWDMNLATLGLCAETALQLSILKDVAPSLIGLQIHEDILL